jgi:hypothetical protein
MSTKRSKSEIKNGLNDETKNPNDEFKTGNYITSKRNIIYIFFPFQLI